MKFIKALSAITLVLCLASCGAPSQEAPERGASCVLDAGDYALRVRRGASEVEFVAPEGVRGTVVRFDADGGCVIDTTRSLGRGESGESADSTEADGENASDGGAAGESEAAGERSGGAAGESEAVGERSGGAAGEYPGVTIPLADGRGFRDWLVLAYPEDYSANTSIAEDGTMTFEADGASYSIAPDGTCSVTRRSLTRTAKRSDD